MVIIDERIMVWFEYAGDLTCSTRTASQFSYQFWRYYYRLIKAANEIIDAAGGDEAKPTGEKWCVFLHKPKL